MKGTRRGLAYEMEMGRGRTWCVGRLREHEEDVLLLPSLDTGGVPRSDRCGRGTLVGPWQREVTPASL